VGLYVGTSGWHYPHWKGRFYPQDLPLSQWFAFYTRHFNTVEINYTFYHMPTETTLRSWDHQAPEGFLYTLKASRAITHRPGRTSSRLYLSHLLCQRARTLGKHLGVLLFQFPPEAPWDPDLLREIRRRCSSERLAFEFRNPEVLTLAEMPQVLRRLGVALCVALAPGLPVVFQSTTNFVYLRFHGVQRWYRDRFTEEHLRPFVAFARQALEQGLEVFAYFNNDYRAYAPENALEFRRWVEGAG